MESIDEERDSIRRQLGMADGTNNKRRASSDEWWDAEGYIADNEEDLNALSLIHI